MTGPPLFLATPKILTDVPQDRKQTGQVRITNQVLNQRAAVRMRDALHLVANGRAKWTGANQISLILSHPQNLYKAEQARRDSERATSRVEFDWSPRESGGATVMQARRAKS